MLVADAEGLAIAAKGRSGGWLVASSQGDSAYGLWRPPDLAPAGRFRIVAGEVGATPGTDGLEVALGDFDQDFPGALVVVQDGYTIPATQSFKLLA